MFSLPQVISMALLHAAKNGNVQACWPHAVFLRVVHTTQPVHLYHFIRSMSFHQPQPTNTTRLTLPRPALNAHKHKSSVRRLIASSLDMLCPNFLSLMYIHASTQQLQALLDKGVHPDDDKDWVRVFSVKGSVSVHIRLVCVAASLPL